MQMIRPPKTVWPIVLAGAMSFLTMALAVLEMERSSYGHAGNDPVTLLYLAFAGATQTMFVAALALGGTRVWSACVLESFFLLVVPFSGLQMRLAITIGFLSSLTLAAVVAGRDPVGRCAWRRSP